VEFQEKIVSAEFFRNFIQTKASLYQNLRNFALLSAILFWCFIALKKFTRVLSYVVCTQVRTHFHKQITKEIYGEGKSGRFVYGKPVLFTLGLGLTTYYSLGLLVSNFKQTFLTVSIRFWQRFEPQIRPTRSAIYFFILTVRAERKVLLCVKLFHFFSWVNTHPFDLKFVAFCPKCSRDSYVEFQEKIVSGEFFRNFVQTKATKTCGISPYFLQFYSESVLL